MSEAHIETTVGSRELQGSCNSCQSRESKSVLVVNLHTIAFRLCRDCAEILKAELERKLEDTWK